MILGAWFRREKEDWLVCWRPRLKTLLRADLTNLELRRMMEEEPAAVEDEGCSASAAVDINVEEEGRRMRAERLLRSGGCGGSSEPRDGPWPIVM